MVSLFIIKHFMNIEKPPGLTCQICGHWEPRALNTHLIAEHNLKTTEYKQQYPKAKTMTGHSKRTIDYWMIQGYTLTQAQEEIKNTQKQGKQQFIQKKLGEGQTAEQAQEEWNKKQAKNSKRASEYWVSRGFSEQEAKHQQSIQQSKYSVKSNRFTGKQHTAASKQKISETMQKHVENYGAESWAQKLYKGRVGIQSAGEVKCYLELQKHLPDLKANITLGSYIADMVYESTVIEYYGDFWHANPQIYKQETLPLIGSTQRIHDRDKKRVEKFAELGYSTYIIWEADWKKNKEEQIEQIKKYISYENTNTNKNTED